MKTRLKEIRKLAGYQTAEQFAEKMGMSVHTYRRYESGAINMYLDVACELCDALGCTLDELAGRTAGNIASMLNGGERKLVGDYRSASEDGKIAISATASAHAGIERAKKDALGSASWTA